MPTCMARATAVFLITGGAFVPPGVWPSGFDGAYLFADYLCGKCAYREPAGYAVSSFATDLGPVIDIVFGPHGTSQALYYTA